MTYVPTPPPASVLLESKFLPLGGIPTSLIGRRPSSFAGPSVRIETLSIKHDAAHTSVGELERL